VRALDIVGPFLIALSCLCAPARLSAQDPVFQDWAARFDGSVGLGGPNPWVYSDYPKAITVDAQGNVFVLGTTERPYATGISRGYRVVRYDTQGNGQTLIGRGQGGVGLGDRGAVAAIALDAAGNIYVAGTFSYGGQYSEPLLDLFVAKYDAQGSELWTEIYDRNPVVSGTFQFSRDDRAVGLVVDAAGSVYVTGIDLTPAI
jgi:hypothetical protein